MLLPRVKAKPGAQPGHGEGLSEGHHAALTLSGVELRRLCLEVPEALPSPRSQAPSRRGQWENAPCRRARWEETANESPAGGGLSEGRWRRSASQGFWKDRAQQGGEGPEGWRERGREERAWSWQQLRKWGWGVGITFHRGALEAGLESGLHPEAAETLKDWGSGPSR